MVTGNGVGTGIPVDDMDPSNHFGQELAMLGDYVWDDKNANGIQDPEDVERGINGVTVKLLGDEDGDGDLDFLLVTGDRR